MSKTRPNLVGDQAHCDQKMTNLKTKIAYATDISVEECCGRQLCENERGTLSKEDHQNIDRSSTTEKFLFTVSVFIRLVSI